MAFFAAYSVAAPYAPAPAFPHAQHDEQPWPAAAPLDLATLPQYQPVAVYSEPQPPCNMPCCVPPAPVPAPAPSMPSVPVYNVSYSLAGALTPIDAPRPTLPPPLPSPAPWTASSAVCYSPDVPSSGEEYFYEPEPSTSGSSCSLSPSPPPIPFVAVKQEELPHTLSAPGSPSRKGRPRRDKSRSGTLIVTGDQQFVCDICGVAFIRKHDGERHRRSHTGERPFPCHGGCGKAFRRADARSRHWGVYRECEWRHTLYLEGTPEGARRERRLLKRAKRAELVLQGVARPLIERILKKM